MYCGFMRFLLVLEHCLGMWIIVLYLNTHHDKAFLWVYQLNQVYAAADQMVLYLSSLVMAGMVHIPACICWEALSENIQYIQNKYTTNIQ